MVSEPTLTMESCGVMGSEPEQAHERKRRRENSKRPGELIGDSGPLPIPFTTFIIASAPPIVKVGPADVYA